MTDRAEFIHQREHIVRDGRLEKKFFACDRMHETESTSMESLSWADVKAVANELLILSGGSTTEYFVATISGVVEKRMSDMLHVDTNLVCSPGLENAFDSRAIAERLNNLVVSYGVLSNLAVRWKYVHLETVFE